MRKTAVVAGATGGIGEAVVAALVASDYRVFALGRTAERLAALQAEAVVPCVVDLAALDALPEMLSGIDRLDALVHCAGVSEVASVEDTPPSAGPVSRSSMALKTTGGRQVLLARRASEGRAVEDKVGRR